MDLQKLRDSLLKHPNEPIPLFFMRNLHSFSASIKERSLAVCNFAYSLPRVFSYPSENELCKFLMKNSGIGSCVEYYDCFRFLF